ncbi:MAG: hypothetical protein CMO01_31710 [Thalassobius sp.]|nr:hypothetical protein [Thalassovita sp.]
MSRKLDRRNWLKQSLTASASLLAGNTLAADVKNFNISKKKKPVAVVAGAGVMGSWTAYFLLKAGYDVTLCDPWGAGNPHASSGGETRLIRYLYGKNEIYFNLAKRSMELWKQEQKAIGKKLFYQNGMLIFSEMPVYDYAEESKALYEANGFKLDKIPAEELKKQYPFIDTDDLNHAIYDKEAGFLLAAESCKQVASSIEQNGGAFKYASVKPGKIEGGKMKEVILPDGTKLNADVFVFANGPWLAKLFPEVLDGKLMVTRQPLFFFSPPKEFAANLKQPFPVWMNRDKANQERSYGVYDPVLDGFKFAYTQLEIREFDPEYDPRIAQQSEIEHARYLMEKRFTFMRNAPLLFSKVCQHTDTADKNFILDQHPECGNVWLMGGGSGHAFKHGPALGELATQQITTSANPIDDFSIKRLATLNSFTKNHK